METNIWLILAPAATALVGSLGSQAITASINLKMKRLELAFTRKADAYKEFMIKAGTFARAPWDDDTYLDFLNSYLAVRIIASTQVLNALSGNRGVQIAAEHLRQTRGAFARRNEVREGVWLVALEAASVAMRADLQNLSPS